MPADRFSSAAEFSKALIDTGFETARVTQHAHPVALQAGKRWKVAAIGLAGIAILLAGIIGWQSRRPATTGPTARYSVYFAGSYSGNSDAPAISPDGSKYIYPTESDGLAIRDRNELDASLIPGAETGWSPFFSPDGETIAFNLGFPGSLMTVPVRGGTPKAVFPDSAYAQGGSWSDDGWLYFLGAYEGVQSLMRVRPSGENPELIAKPDTANNELFFYWPDVLPGGNAVLVTLWRRRGPSDIVAIDLKTRKLHQLGNGVRAMYAGNEILVVVQPDGSVNAVRFDPRKLTTSGRPTAVLTGIWTGGQGRPPIALSRSGSLMYEAYKPVNQVVRVDRAGTIQPVESGWTGIFTHLANSPDGSRIAVAVAQNARTDIWSKDLRSGTFTRLASEGTYSYRPSWSPDGQRVLFISDRSGKPALYSVAADGGSAPRLLKENVWGVDEAETSRDGRWVLHRVGSGSARDIYVSGTTGDTTARPLVNTDAEEFSPTLSPDGRWLAYSADGSRRAEIYVRPFPDAGSARWQVSRSGGTEPVWSHDGRELFYKDSESYLTAAQLAGGEEFRVTGERRLFRTQGFISDNRHRSYSVSPDGRHFYFMGTLPGRPSQMVVITNWAEELRQKLSRAN